MTRALRIISSVFRRTWMKSLRPPMVLISCDVEQHARPARGPGSRGKRSKDREAS